MALAEQDAALARDSLYALTAPALPAGVARPPLLGAMDADVAVVGGGLAGVSAALDLRRAGFDVVLVEAGSLGGGASGRNGGQAIHGLACEPETIERELGLDAARQVFAMSVEALDLLRSRIAEHAIDCEWRDGWLGLATSPRKARALADSADRLERVYRYPLARIGAGDVGRWIASPRYHGGVHDPRSGHLHPLKYLRGLATAAAAAGVRLHEGTRAHRLEPGVPSLLHLRSVLGEGCIRARRVLLAGNAMLHALAPGLLPGGAARVMPVGTYVGATAPLDSAVAASLIPDGSAVCDSNFVLDYFRVDGGQRLLYGGRVSYSTATPARLAALLERQMHRSFPQLAGTRIERCWGGFVDITMNRAPDFGRLPGPGEVYWLQGFSGHGVALTGLAGRLVAEAMTGDASRFDVFARLRHRPFPGGAALRTPLLVLGMAWYRLRDML